MKASFVPVGKPAKWIIPLTFACLLLTPSARWAKDGKPDFEPTIRLEKPVYLMGEAVRFWVGMRSTNGSPVPLDKPCTLSITKPDGSRDTRTVGPPLDRMLGATFSEGGMDLGDNLRPGKYVLVWACSGQQTKPVEVKIEQNDIFDQLNAEFKFERSGNVEMGESLPVVLSVQNDSPYTIRFPERGVSGAEISVGAIRENPPYTNVTFYPAEKLSHSTTSALTYTWDVALQIPSVVLKPGEHFEQKFLFEDAYSFDQPGKYKVMFSTVLQVLVGEKNGPFAPVCPIRLPASSVEQLEVVK